ncbi:MAG TPA: hypothetical protein VMM76_04890 [Pirellulaceae bacterium]|nr:hypothetical protein [Pirellulaceae bacterium]
MSSWTNASLLWVTEPIQFLTDEISRLAIACGSSAYVCPQEEPHAIA